VQPDTVEVAAATPDREQPHRDLGLTADEYDRVRATLGRRPTDTELAMYSVMWSEHCSYKSSKVHLRRFADTATSRLLAGMGENAGVVDVGDGLAVTFKVESHNHPSFVEPYQGAATGVGGIVRDILTMGARPIAVMDALRFGDPTETDTRRVVGGVVAGIAGYGNCLGLPNVGGETAFDPSYNGNPLVNALCVGVLPHTRLQHARATGPGSAVVLLGAKTGRDGIGGVSVLASSAFDDGAGSTKRPSVQVGDPFTEKLLIECCLELFDAGLVTGIQDLGGAGLTCATSETASHGGVGMTVALDRVPLREPSMDPLEVATSESQERMLAVVAADRLAEVLAVCDRWGVLATAIGAVTATGRLVMTWHGETVADVPPASLADDGPVYHRPLEVPADQDQINADDPARLPRPRSGPELADAVLRLAGSPDLCSRRWVTEQYDRYVLGNTVLAPPHDGGVLRLDESTGRGIALAMDGAGRYSRLDPYAGAQAAFAEAYRNVAVAGAEPVAASDCLNFGSPEDPEVMWQFAEAVRGAADAARELGVPVTGGNVSFYNSTAGRPIHPTPVIAVLGLLDDVRRRLPLGFRTPGAHVLLLGDTADELGGSDWAWVVHRHLGGRPPVVRLPAERALARVLVAAARAGLVDCAHDLSGGGLSQALVESCLDGGVGVTVRLPAGADPFVLLFSESAARALVAVPADALEEFQRLCAREQVPVRALGQTGGDALTLSGLFSLPLHRLRAAAEGTLPALFG
jgi:phosphoribosylformylglycinamidine synthase II